MPYIKPQETPPANQNQVNIRQPEAFDFTKPETWPTWEKRFQRFISVANLSWKTSKEKIDLLCYTMGEQSEAILLKIFPNAETKTVDQVLKAFNDYFTPKRNIILERFHFNSRVQLSGESVETFITDLYSLAEKCDYFTSKEDLIRDRIVIGIRDDKTSLRLQLKSDLTLATAIAEVKLAESQEQESQLVRHSKGQEAHKMKKHTQTKALKGSESDTKNCHQCGLPSHLQGELCRAKNSRCRRCSQFGHWDRVCRSKDSLFREKACSSSQNTRDDGFRMSSKFRSLEQSSSNATLINHINISLAKNGLQAITSSSEKFSNSFFKVLANSNSGTLITSPVSVQILLAMVAYGAGGKTATQMRTALQLPIENSLGQSGYWSLIKTLNLFEKHVELHIANKIFVASYVTVKPAYQELTTKVFLSSSQCIDFTNSRAAAKTINTSCENRMNKKVTEVVQRDSFGPDTVLGLMNVLYFKGQWKYPFTRLRLKSRFFADETSRVYVNSMVIKHHFRFGDLPKQDAKFLEIPYKVFRIKMILMLFLHDLHQLNLRQSLQAVLPRFVEIDVLEFKIESSVNLTPILETLGMTSMFGAAADFSGIADGPLNVTKVVQTAIIEVTEIFTEAAAAPCECKWAIKFEVNQQRFVSLLKLYQSLAKRQAFYPLHAWRAAREDDGTITPTFIVDQPFYFMIYHHHTGISLFTGIVKHSNCFV